MKNYYNTTNESGQQLKTFETKAKTQNENQSSQKIMQLTREIFIKKTKIMINNKHH